MHNNSFLKFITQKKINQLMKLSQITIDINSYSNLKIMIQPQVTQVLQAMDLKELIGIKYMLPRMKFNLKLNQMILNMPLLLLVIDLEKTIKFLIQQLFMISENQQLKHSMDLRNGYTFPQLKENLKLYVKNLKFSLKMKKKSVLLLYLIKNSSRKVTLN